MYLKELNIGNVKCKNNIFLAPMAGITDLPFRLICEKFEPGLVVTEMVSSKALLYNDEKTKTLLKVDGEKRPISIQIFGSDEEAMAYGAKYVSNLADIVDINMGCPAPKVTKNGDGSKLLTDLQQAGKVIDAVVKNSTVPVTLKIRTGWDKENIVATEIAKIAESLGVSAIVVHGRTRTDYYSGKADLEEIRKVKEAVNIPVIGNGDIVDEESAVNMFKKTGCDGIMIGRGVLGNPWIFQKIKHFLETGEKLSEVSLKKKFIIIKEHFLLEIAEKGEYTGIREFRKHLAYYTKGLPNSSEFRCKINELESKEEVMAELEVFYKRRKL
ncbi:MAG: tRNA dihydrouridine synthase DusB [Clostridia bacterium]|nr:tRNA dihydrouridine synthase DusB [Clostridia bacterium]